MFTGFSPDLFSFFDELSANNNREWFADNKSRFEQTVRQPALEFITAMEGPLKKVTPHFTAIPKKVGGSLMRIYRDIRFSKEKIPYKTNLGIHFRHEAGKDVHAPGFYFHIDTDEIFVGAGIWRPDSTALNKIRHLIDDDPSRWKRINNRKSFRETFSATGDTLKRPPKGFDEEHPLIVDLKRKDHIVLASMTRKEVASTKLVENVAAKFKLSLPYVRFLCDAVHLPS
jgi:uncharacterized protein (TIGR02453 family)